MMKKSLIFFCFIFFLCSRTCFAEDAAASPFLEHMAHARNAYSAVQNYVCLFEKEEVADGKLADKEHIYLKFEKPFKIFMHWQNDPKKGLQVLYERGRHDGKLGIHKPGLLLGLMPVVFLEQDSPWVREGSEAYDIEDAGIGTFLEDLDEETSVAAKEGRLRTVSGGAVELEGIHGEQFDVYFDGTTPESDVMAYHVRVVFDSVTQLPLYQELYDWNDRLTGRYVYKDLRLNVGEDPDFRKHIHRTLHRIYTNPEG